MLETTCLVICTSVLGVLTKKSAKVEGIGDCKIAQDIQKDMAVLSYIQSKFSIVQPVNKSLMGASTVRGTLY